MAAKKRFPSDANKMLPKDADLGSVAGEVPKESQGQMVKGSSQKLVQVEYMKDNHHVLGSVSSVHAVRKGVNHLPEHVWAEAKKHPSVQKMLETGDLVEMSEDAEDEQEKEVVEE